MDAILGILIGTATSLGFHHLEENYWERAIERHLRRLRRADERWNNYRRSLGYS